MRKMMFADQDLDIDTEVIRKPEHLHYAPDTMLTVFGKLENFDVHDHPVQVFHVLDLRRGRTDAIHAHTIGAGGGRWNLHAFGNLNPLLNAIIRGDHEVAAPVYAKLAD